jgi:Protein of unknown function (DUF3187)
VNVQGGRWRRRPRGARRWIAVPIVAVLTVARPLAAAEFDFVGPAPTRNFQPIQLIFLNLPFESATTLAAGGLSLRLDSAESNVISTTEGTYTSTLKFETNRTVLGFRYGLLEGWEVGMELPFITRWGGFLDPIIDGVEELFNSENPERKIFPQNSFGGFIVLRDDQIVFHGGQETFQPGDLVFLLKHSLRMPRDWPRVALRAAIKAPTGDVGEVNGSGKPDFGAGIAADYQPFDRLMLYLNFDVVYPVGPITDANLTLNPMIDQSFAAHLALTQRWSVMLHQATYTSPFHGTHTSLLDGTVVELGGGMNFAFSPEFSAQLLGINNVSGVEQSADFTLMLAFQFRPWAVSPHLPPIGPPPPPQALPPVDALPPHAPPQSPPQSP